MTTCSIAIFFEHVLSKALENLSIGWLTDLVDIFKQLRFYNYSSTCIVLVASGIILLLLQRSEAQPLLNSGFYCLLAIEHI